MTYAQLKPLPPLKPLKFPGDLDPSRQKIVCRFCGSTLTSPDSKNDAVAPTICPNCGQENAATIIGINEHKPDDKGKQYNPFSINNPMFAPKGLPMVSFNRKKILESQLTTRKRDRKMKRVRDTFLSKEIKQCPDLSEINSRRKKNKVVDNLEDITKSCEDLAIDG